MKHKHAADVASEACRSRIAENEVALETLKEALAHSTAEARRCRVGICRMPDDSIGTMEAEVCRHGRYGCITPLQTIVMLGDTW